MMRSLRDVRLVPVVLVAAGALFILKLAGLVFDGGYTLGAGHLSKSDRAAREAAEIAASRLLRPPPQVNAAIPDKTPAKSWAQQMLNYPDVTGSVAAKSTEKKDGGKPEAEKKDADKKDGDKKEAVKPVDPPPSPGGVVIPLEPKPVSAAERAILERLTERRQELDARERELAIRETLLQAQEKRLEVKVLELKDVEAKIQAANQKKQDAETAKLKGLVTMYENMKAKEAAKIFERLEVRLATEVASQIAPRRMSDILAQMSPESAERLTVELANKNATDKTQPAPDLPKIEAKAGGT
jgi:flagellar motility protein MotE (MotC chaperone)